MLQRVLYAELAALPASRWLDVGGGVASVNLFYADVASFSEARRLLPPKDQKAFDEAVLQRVRELWDDCDDIGRIGLATLLPIHAPSAGLPDLQIDFLRLAAKKRLSTTPLETLLVSASALKQTTDMQRTQRRDLADLLAASHRQAEIWELSQKQAWPQWLDERQRKDFRSEEIFYESSRQKRLARFLEALNQFAGSSSIAPWLSQECSEFGRLTEQYLSRNR